MQTQPAHITRARASSDRTTVAWHSKTSDGTPLLTITSGPAIVAQYVGGEPEQLERIADDWVSQHHRAFTA